MFQRLFLIRILYFLILLLLGITYCPRLQDKLIGNTEICGGRAIFRGDWGTDEPKFRLTYLVTDTFVFSQPLQNPPELYIETLKKVLFFTPKCRIFQLIHCAKPHQKAIS
jgi:hypothetical protein